MFESAIVYSGLVLAAAGLVLTVNPIRRLGVPTRTRGLAAAGAGALVAATGMILPAPESRVARVDTHLDEFAPVWQFSEHHAISIAAPPSRVFAAIRRVKADEIFLFRTLTWIRRGGRPLPPGILNAGDHEPLLALALHSGFVSLAESLRGSWLSGP